MDIIADNDRKQYDSGKQIADAAEKFELIKILTPSLEM